MSGLGEMATRVREKAVERVMRDYDDMIKRNFRKVMNLEMTRDQFWTSADEWVERERSIVAQIYRAEPPLDERYLGV